MISNEENHMDFILKQNSDSKQTQETNSKLETPKDVCLKKETDSLNPKVISKKQQADSETETPKEETDSEPENSLHVSLEEINPKDVSPKQGTNSDKEVSVYCALCSA